MAYEPRAIANWFLDRSERDGKQLTQMQLQKLIYISHGWSLALLDEPLILDPVEAWKFGPVIRALYREFSDCGKDPITHKAFVFDGSRLEDHEISLDDYDGEGVAITKRLCERIWEVYGELSAFQLSSLTHQPGTPWYKVWHDQGGNSRRYAVIPDALIKEHFNQLAGSNG